MEKADLEPALKALKDRLMTKNVVCCVYVLNWLRCVFTSVEMLTALTHGICCVIQAEEIAEKLCESVAVSLEGKKLASFTRISSTVQVSGFNQFISCFVILINLWIVDVN